MQWLVDGYTVALASLLLAGAVLGDRLGHRRIVAIGLVIFAAASVGCALAPSAGPLVAARVVQGAGAAMLLPGSIAAINDAYPDAKDQARALGIWAGVSSLALPAGPLLGGLLVQTSGWRAVFWINPPVTAISLVGLLVWARVPERRRRRRLDPAGLGLGTIGLAAVVYTVIAAGTDALAAAAAGTVGALAIVALLLVERRVAEPLLPPSLLRRRPFAAANASALVMDLTSNGLTFGATRYLQSVLGHSALDAGIMLLPMFIPLAALSPTAGRLTARHGPQPVLLAGALLAAAGQLCLVLVTPASGYPRLIPALIGVGLFTSASRSMAPSSARPPIQATSSRRCVVSRSPEPCSGSRWPRSPPPRHEHNERSAVGLWIEADGGTPSGDGGN